MGIQTVKAGSFDFTPNKLAPFIGFDRVGYACLFHENCNYVYADPAQQGDVLKLGGVAFSLFPWVKHENTAMVGFRCNPQTDYMELFDYWHVNGQTDNAIGREPIAYVRRKELFAWWIRADKEKRLVSVNIRTKEGGTVSKVMQFDKLSTLLCWPVGGYAGGSEKAVQEMSFAEDRLTRWDANGPVLNF
jgi:hypothetical protein